MNEQVFKLSLCLLNKIPATRSSNNNLYFWPIFPQSKQFPVVLADVLSSLNNDVVNLLWRTCQGPPHQCFKFAVMYAAALVDWLPWWWILHVSDILTPPSPKGCFIFLLMLARTQQSQLCLLFVTHWHHHYHHYNPDIMSNGKQGLCNPFKILQANLFPINELNWQRLVETGS